MIITDFFDRVQIINLVNRPDRKKEIVSELRKISVKVDNKKVRINSVIKPIESHGFPNIGAYGCFMSHLNILRQAIEDDVERLLIIEDDVNFISDINKKLPVILDKLNNNKWDICYLGNEVDEIKNLTKIFVNYNKPIVCAHLYAIHKRILPQLVNFLEKLLSRTPGDPAGGPMHYDGALNTFRQQYTSISTLVLLRPIGFQRASRTDIHKLYFYDRIIFFRNSLNFIRRIKNTLRSFIR